MEKRATYNKTKQNKAEKKNDTIYTTAMLT